MYPAHQPSALNSYRLAHKVIALKCLTTISSLSVTAALFLSQSSDVFNYQWLPLNLLLSMDTSLAQRLIEKGVNVNAQDGEGNTPLHAVGAR
ncbi:MAG: ankyrin repeat domain-containing protein [Phormidesmis sp.]